MQKQNLGPLTSEENWKSNVESGIEMRSLSLKDLAIIKNFFEKGRRASFFSREEMFTIEIIQKKICNLIDDVVKKNKNIQK